MKLSMARRTAGRARGAIYDMMLRAAILEDDFLSIDRATFDPARWPTGNTRYLYGSLFFTFLADQHGPAAVSDFVRGYSGQLIPYRLQAAARRAFGNTFTREWQLWQDSLRDRVLPLADDIVVLPGHGMQTSIGRERAINPFLAELIEQG
jgi:hypothetical protein